MSEKKTDKAVNEIKHANPAEDGDLDIKCPHLGMQNDPETYLNYPSVWNLCYHARPLVVPALNHQRIACLGRSYTQCPIYMKEANGKMPPELAEQVDRLNGKKWLLGLLIVVALLLLGGAILLVRQFNKPAVSPPTADLTRTSQVELTGAMSLTSLAAETGTLVAAQSTAVPSTPVPTAQVTPVATEQAPVVGHELDSPIGSDQKFIIHRILDGESLEQFAVLYNTDRETIKAVNYLLPVPLWINWLIIIPLDLTAPGDLPTFEAYLVTDEKVTVDKLAEKMALDPQQLAYYNGVDREAVFESGDWLLIPREGYFFDY